MFDVPPSAFPKTAPLASPSAVGAQFVCAFRRESRDAEFDGPKSAGKFRRARTTTSHREPRADCFIRENKKSGVERLRSRESEARAASDAYFFFAPLAGFSVFSTFGFTAAFSSPGRSSFVSGVISIVASCVATASAGTLPARGMT